MTVLVTAASKHGATAEIAESIAGDLKSHGAAAEYLPVRDVQAVEAYAAVVIGSAVYAGRWLPEAKAFVEHHVEVLRRRPVWIFSSGPVGDPAEPAEPPADVAAMLSTTGAREHRLFCGRLDKQLLGFAERSIVRVVRAAEGDYRDWSAIADWAGSIAIALPAEPVALPESLPGSLG